MYIIRTIRVILAVNAGSILEHKLLRGHVADVLSHRRTVRGVNVRLK